MVKLIRLLGDSDQNNTEIRNTFRQPIIIKPNAKVALVGASVLLTDDFVNEKFVIDENNGQFKLGEVNNMLDCEMTAGEYFAHPLVNEFVTAGNYAGTDTSGLGLHHTAEIINNTLALTTHKTLFSQPEFNDTNKWEIVSGTATTTIDSVTAGAGGAEIVSFVWQSTIPMVHNRFKATLLDCSGKELFLSGWTGDDHVWGIEVKSNGTYYKVLNNVHTSLGTTWAVNDVITMDTYAGGYHLTITSSTGTVKKQEDVNLAISRDYYGQLKTNRRWYMSMSGNVAITSCACTTLYNVPDNSLLTDSEVSASLQFKNVNDLTNMLLAIYLGFGLSGGSLITYTGNPATVSGRGELTGLPSYPGILVTIDGLGPLQSYDGAGASKAPDNILYVLNDLSIVSGNQLQLDIPAPFYLDMNNAHPINVNELRARFLPATGQKQNPSLAFSGNPSITLLIDG